ncbi:MAG: hypothetical protein R2744_00415 [Bacteroidales bacterium]
MKFRISLTIIILLLGAGKTDSQVVYDLGQCIASGLENNYSIIVAGKER